LVKDWFHAHSRGRSIAIGIANGGLHLLEHFKSAFPLTEGDYTSPGVSQVKGLSGASGDRIVARFLPGMSSIGTEAGRTSRGTLPAVRELAELLNGRADLIQPLNPSEREHVAEAMQRWIVENPIRSYFERKKLSPSLDTRHTSPANIASILAAAKERDQMGQVAQHLVGAKLALRFPKRKIQNYSYSTADVVTGRPGDFLVGSSVFHVTIAPSSAVLEKCMQNIKQGYRPFLLVPEDKRRGTYEMADSLALADVVAVMGIESFVGQNVEEIAEFGQPEFEAELRRLLEIYNERVREVEPDPSLQIDIPDKLGR
jgi:hypothetical protein